jgi:phosphomannomutase/phosphoglucomutase
MIFFELLKLEHENIEKIDGLKLWFNSNTWVLIRSSGTEPAIRIFAESNDQNYLNEVCSTCITIINEFLD